MKIRKAWNDKHGKRKVLNNTATLKKGKKSKGHYFQIRNGMVLFKIVWFVRYKIMLNLRNIRLFDNETSENVFFFNLKNFRIIIKKVSKKIYHLIFSTF